MKYASFFILLVLLIPSTLAIADVNFVMENIQPQQTAIGDIYLYYPQIPILENVQIPIGVIIVFTPGAQASIELSGIEQIISSDTASGDITTDQPYHQQEWVLLSEKEKTYVMSILDDAGDTIINQQISPDVRDKLLVNETKKDINRVDITQEETTVQEAQTTYNNYFSKNYSEEAFILAEEQGALEAKIFKERQVITQTFTDGSVETKTRVTMRVQPLIKDADVNLIEVVPKSVAEYVYEMKLSNTAIILKEDPVIMWHISGNEPVDIMYEVKGDQTLTGNTVLVSAAIHEPVKQGVSWKIMGAIALIPLIAGIIFFFSKYEKK